MNEPTKSDVRRELNHHVSAADLKKIRGGVAAGGKLTPDGRRVEKSDEDFPTALSALSRFRAGGNPFGGQGGTPVPSGGALG